MDSDRCSQWMDRDHLWPPSSVQWPPSEKRREPKRKSSVVSAPKRRSRSKPVQGFVQGGHLFEAVLKTLGQEQSNARAWRRPKAEVPKPASVRVRS